VYNHIIDSDMKWVIDSAASYNSVPKREYFNFYRVRSSGSVKMGNSDVVDVVGLCDICIKTNASCTIVLKNVKHIPYLSLNLISMTTLDREGHKYQLGEDT